MSSFNPSDALFAHFAGDAGSEDRSSEASSVCGARSRASKPVILPPPQRYGPPQSFGQHSNTETRKLGSGSFCGMNAYERHKQFINAYVVGRERERQLLAAADALTKEGRTDFDVLRDGYRFVRSGPEVTWEDRLARKYYDKLFKEYALADLSRYKEGKVGLRWRVEREVFTGRGQFSCGNLACRETCGLCSFEVNFAYKEAGEHKNALVKLRLCPSCGLKLNYQSLKRAREEKRSAKKHKKKNAKKRRRRDGDGDNNNDGDDGSSDSSSDSVGSSSRPDDPPAPAPTPRAAPPTCAAAPPSSTTSSTTTTIQPTVVDAVNESTFEQYFDQACAGLFA